MKRLYAFNKNYILIAGSIILAVIAYELAFKKTIGLIQLHRQLSKQLTEATDLSIEPGYIIRKNINLDKILATYKQDSVNFRNNVVNDITTLADMQNVKLTNVPMDDQAYHTSQYIIQKLAFEGDFFSSLKLIDKLQNTQAIGILRSVSIKRPKTQNQNVATNKLTLEIYMEMYR